MLEGVGVEDIEDGSRFTLPAREIMVFVGADPCTAWLAGTLALDSGGYVRTGPDAVSPDRDRPEGPVSPPELLETNVPGVFAAGDVGSGSVKRVASAVGEGAMAIRLVREHLAQVRQRGGDGVAGPPGIPIFERFFRSVARLKMDKNDIKRYREFVDGMIDDIAIAGRNSARWNARDVIAPMDLPITKGLQERMREFDQLDEAGEIRAILAQNVRRPPADVTFSEETEELLAELFGGLSIALARSFRGVDPDVVSPAPEHWERVTEIFRQVL